MWRCEPPSPKLSLVDRPSAFFDDSVGRVQALFASNLSDNGSALPGQCFHPRHLVPANPDMQTTHLNTSADPAAPHIALQYVQRILLRNAFALAFTTGRRLVLPRLWALCERHWWQLRDCRTPGVELLPMPYEAPLDLIFNADRFSSIRGVQFVEPSFVDHQLAPAELRTSVASIRSSPAADGTPGTAAAFHVAPGIGFDDAAAQLPAAAREAKLLEIDVHSLLAFSPCGFSSNAVGRRFQQQVRRPSEGVAATFISAVMTHFSTRSCVRLSLGRYSSTRWRGSTHTAARSGIRGWTPSYSRRGSGASRRIRFSTRGVTGAPSGCMRLTSLESVRLAL